MEASPAWKALFPPLPHPFSLKSVLPLWGCSLLTYSPVMTWPPGPPAASQCLFFPTIHWRGCAHSVLPSWYSVTEFYFSSSLAWPYRPCMKDKDFTTPCLSLGSKCCGCPVAWISEQRSISPQPTPWPLTFGRSPVMNAHLMPLLGETQWQCCPPWG